MSRLTQCADLVRTRVFAKFTLLGLFLIVLLSSILHFRDIRNAGQYLNAAEKHAIEIADVKSTGDEERCFYSVTPAPNPIPKIVHVAWLENPELNFMTYLTIRSAIVSIKPDRINLHYTSLNETNEWFHEIRDHVYLVQHDLRKEYQKEMEANWEIQHITDLIRLDAIAKEGGIYLNTDVLALRSFDNLLNSEADVILGHEDANRTTLSNAIIVGRRGSTFINRWRASYGNFSSHGENYHSTILPKRLSQQHPNETCALSPLAFSWPSWNPGHIQYMHEHLSQDEAKDFAKKLVSNNGRMRQTQLAYYGGGQNATSHLDRLDADSVKQNETRFNIMARRFLP